jgi:circadian clock protein KaiC
MDNPAVLFDGHLPKVPTGIQGLDEIMCGGFPKGRTTLVCGGAGSGKTLLGMQFLIRGAIDRGVPGVFVSFEESESDLVGNFASLGFDLNRLQQERKILIDQVRVERAEIEETGEYDLEGLFVRVGHAVAVLGAQHVVLDTLEALFAGFSNESILRSEFRRLFSWLKERGLTAIITAERGHAAGAITRHGLEEYVSDCVIVLDHRMKDQISTRRLRVAKFRGSTHGTNEYPFLIDQGGATVLPITSVGLDYTVSSEPVSTGLPRLNTMLGGGGYYKGSSVLISGTPGTGKSSIAAKFAEETCRRGGRCLYYSFEESDHQILRNMRSIGMDLEPWVEKGLLLFQSMRPTFYGLEMHLGRMHKLIHDFDPAAFVMDPISNLITIGDSDEVRTALMRLVDLLKKRQVTSVFTSLTPAVQVLEESGMGVSSIMDTWILLQDIDSNGERNRGLSIVKSRGMRHSNQIREFIMSDTGLELVDVYTGPAGVMTGAARITQELREKAAKEEHVLELDRKRRELVRKRQITEAQISMLRMQLEAEEETMAHRVKEHEARLQTESEGRKQMSRIRSAGGNER